jgi:drug/metabolite transporter (DMT)-like permease
MMRHGLLLLLLSAWAARTAAFQHTGGPRPGVVVPARIVSRRHNHRKYSSSSSRKGQALGGATTPLPAPGRLSTLKSSVALLLPPLLWGSYAPLIKGLYTSPLLVTPPPPLLFDFMSVGMSFVALCTLSRFSGALRADDTPLPSSPADVTNNVNGGGGGGNNGVALALAGAELGLWLYIGDTLLLLGLQSTTAIRAAIFSQLSTIIVPFLDSAFFSRDKVPPRLWLACAASLVGVVLVSCDGGQMAAVTEASAITSATAAVAAEATATATAAAAAAAAATSLSLADQLTAHGQSVSRGDVLAVLSAVFTSIYLIRLSHHSARTPDSVALSSSMSITELALAAGSLVAACTTPVGSYLGIGDTNSFEGVADYVHIALASPYETGQVVIALAVLWNGVFGTALANSAMAYGQRDASPVVANVCYSFQPVFAAAFSYVLLGETVGTFTAAGSALLVGAILFAFASPTPTPTLTPDRAEEAP